ncbi:MAG: hypothetical protein QM754_18385 [Tepidisphaeraceae bacterium]
MKTIYSYSTNEEIYSHENFETIEAACHAAAKIVGCGEYIWVGEVVEPSPPESLWHAEHWLEHVSVQDEYGGDHAEDGDCSTDSQRQELEREVRAVMAAWLDRHDLRPTFHNVTNARKYRVTGFTGDAYEVAEVTEVLAKH